MQNPNVLMRTLPIVAKALGDNLGLEVIVAGSEARTNGKTVVIPSLPLDHPELAQLSYGYIAHESGHVKHTNMACFAEKRPFHRELLNVLEDIRTESLIVAEYPGTASDLDAVTRKLDSGVSLV